MSVWQLVRPTRRQTQGEGAVLVLEWTMSYSTICPHGLSKLIEVAWLPMLLAFISQSNTVYLRDSPQGNKYESTQRIGSGKPVTREHHSTDTVSSEQWKLGWNLRWPDIPGSVFGGLSPVKCIKSKFAPGFLLLKVLVKRNKLIKRQENLISFYVRDLVTYNRLREHAKISTLRQENLTS